jgi:hypothetical protein
MNARRSPHTAKSLVALMRERPEFFVINTKRPSGDEYALNDGNGVRPRVMDDLFAGTDQELIAQEDGLFPGFSQTWRASR